MKWVQIIPDAWRAVHHAHVYVDLPEGADRDGLGLNMGSNVGNSMDLIGTAPATTPTFSRTAPRRS